MGSPTTKETRNRSCCCISHEFLRTAASNPTKLAVIHASTSNQLSLTHNHNQQKEEDLTKAVHMFDEMPACKFPRYSADVGFTFGDLLASVESLAFRLSSALHGDKGGDDNVCPVSGESGDGCMPKIVGIYMLPSVEYIVSVLSVLRCGEAFLPLDPWWPKERILSVISSSNVQLIIVSGNPFGGNDSYKVDGAHWIYKGTNCHVLSVKVEDCVPEEVNLLNLHWACESVRKRDFCYLMYTSGSTGKPKGVCGTEQGLLNRFLWMQEAYPFFEEDNILFKTSISFIDHLQEFLGAILSACTLVIPPFSELKDNIFSILDFLQAYSINRLIAVPSLMRVILPTLESRQYRQVVSSLQLLVLSGEVLPLSLWKMLASALPNTCILNLYGSTEVSGDCTYFDCKRLPQILETEEITSIPIGRPIYNCHVLLDGEDDVSHEGEICVSGVCVYCGIFSNSSYMSTEFAAMCRNSACGGSSNCNNDNLYYRTGDFGKRLRSGDLVFLGRKDRTIKINGQRVALEEIECTLRAHPHVNDAAILLHRGPDEYASLEAFLILKGIDKSPELYSSIRNWMADRFPVAVIPNRFIFTESFPLSSSGKVDYKILADSLLPSMHVHDETANFLTSGLLQTVKKAFCDVLMIEDMPDDGNFFALGGSSISAAHVSYNLGIDMRLVYKYPTPSKLQDAILWTKGSLKLGQLIKTDSEMNQKEVGRYATVDTLSKFYNLHSHKSKSSSFMMPKRLKVTTEAYNNKIDAIPRFSYLWNPELKSMSCSISRCNKVIYGRDTKEKDIPQATCSAKVPCKRKGYMQELWKVDLGSCVDASPTIIFKGLDVYLFIGSHSHKFICVNARSGSVLWEIRLEGRIECSAAVVDDFSQIVVGCYMGKIYFLDFSNGQINWTFQTSGEVKSQPVLDISRKLIWCGAHDHNLYALDYENHCCVYKHACGGSVFGSPVIDKEHDTLYVASTSGRVTAISLEASSFNIMWQNELAVPIFGSLCISPPNGNVICCLVDGHVIALDPSGSIIWKSRTGGPIFAGPSMSFALASQVLICCRNGHVFSFEADTGNIIWDYDVGDPITASVYVDENVQLVADHLRSSDNHRLICVCTSSGGVYMLRVDPNFDKETRQLGSNMVEEFATLRLQGDIFSSPVMIDGRIFVGCRDDNIYCIGVGFGSYVEE